jgi:hypothetical protein
MKERKFIVTIIIPADVDDSSANASRIAEVLRENGYDLGFSDCAFEVDELK